MDKARFKATMDQECFPGHGSGLERPNIDVDLLSLEVENNKFNVYHHSRQLQELLEHLVPTLPYGHLQCGPGKF